MSSTDTYLLFLSAYLAAFAAVAALVVRPWSLGDRHRQEKSATF